MRCGSQRFYEVRIVCVWNRSIIRIILICFWWLLLVLMGSRGVSWAVWGLCLPFSWWFGTLPYQIVTSKKVKKSKNSVESQQSTVAKSNWPVGVTSSWHVGVTSSWPVRVWSNNTCAISFNSVIYCWNLKDTYYAAVLFWDIHMIL